MSERKIIPVPLRDINGHYVVIGDDVLFDYFTSSVATVMGVDLVCIARFKAEYWARGGQEPITPESIRAAFKT